MQHLIQQKAAPKSPQEGDIPYVNRADVVAAATAAGAAGASKEACQSLLRALALGKGAARPLTLPGASRPRRNSVTGGAMTALHGLLAVDMVAVPAPRAPLAVMMNRESAAMRRFCWQNDVPARSGSAPIELLPLADS